MTPTSFTFTVTMPADARLVGAVRELTTQAANYAQVSGDAVKALADRVAAETEKAVAAPGAREHPIEIVFDGTDQSVSITLSRNSVQIGRIDHTLQG